MALTFHAKAVLPIRTVSEANVRTHWSVRAKRAKLHRGAARLSMRHVLPKPCPTVTVTLTRMAPKELDDDNIRGALKAVRDGVADALGVDDRDQRVTWCYAQERAKDYAVTIVLEIEGK